MKVLLPRSQAGVLIRALRDAGLREIGGILMGEFVSEGVYRIHDLSVQRGLGTLSTFVRQVKDLVRPLESFFQRTGRRYTTYNYLGEWHSHPCFPVRPSGRDSESMWEIVEDPTVGAHFAVLLVVRLTSDMQLEGSATMYLLGRQVFPADLVMEEDDG